MYRSGWVSLEITNVNLLWLSWGLYIGGFELSGSWAAHGGPACILPRQCGVKLNMFIIHVALWWLPARPMGSHLINLFRAAVANLQADGQVGTASQSVPRTLRTRGQRLHSVGPTSATLARHCADASPPSLPRRIGSCTWEIIVRYYHCWSGTTPMCIAHALPP